MKKSYRPQRTCLGCGARDDQRALIRLTVTAEGDLKIDERQGRGGYLHRSQDCWRAFLARRSQYRAFRIEIGRTQKEELLRELERRNRE